MTRQVKRKELKPLQSRVLCPRCNGARVENVSTERGKPRIVTCRVCQGRGRVVEGSLWL
jgi:transcription elongation factor Elf1